MNRGLIEADADIMQTISIQSLPRFMNRGLIEAEVDENLQGIPGTLPRFMNRGLIEALRLSAERCQ